MNGLLSIDITKTKDKDCKMQIDEKMFCALIKENKEYLYRIAYAYAKNEDFALDILQETTFKAYKNMHKLNEICYFRTWITRILINTAINVINKNKRTFILMKLINKDEVHKSISSEEKMDLYNAIDLLEDKYKMIIILKYFNDMKIKDISASMNMPEGTIKTYLKRAKDKLNAKLGEGYMHE